MWDNDKSRAVDSYDYKVSPNPNDNCVCGSRSYIKLIIIHCTTYSIATRVFFPPFCFSFFFIFTMGELTSTVDITLVSVNTCVMYMLLTFVICFFLC